MRRVAKRIAVEVFPCFANNHDMAKDHAPAEETAKQNRRVLLRPHTFAQMEALADRDECEIAELVNRACRELLRAEGLWPPSPKEEAST